MTARLSIDDKLAALEAAGDDGDAQSLPAVLLPAIADRNHRVVALAARLSAQKLVYASVPPLCTAYARFLDKPVKRDPNCFAKKAIVRALFELDCDAADFYLAALRYRQPEPVWGGTVDTAADLRCSAAMGLVASGYPRALVEVAALLTDTEPPVRAGAARAIACGNPREAELLLRLKVATGDEDPFVIGECFTGLLTVEPDESVAFVADYLDAGDDAVREAAALALGESRLPAALDSLIAAWEGVLVPDGYQRILIRAATIHRSEAAFDWLLALVAEREAAIVSEIVGALSIYRHNEKLMARLDAALAERAGLTPASRARRPRS